MTLDERQVTDALSTYAEGLVMTSDEIDRMQRDLRRRLDQPHRSTGRVLATAAVLVLIAAIVTGAWWLRRPTAAVVPATPQPVQSLTGLWKWSDPDTKLVFVVRADNSVRAYPNARTLVRHVTGDPFTAVSDGQHVVVDGTDTQGRPCRSTRAVLSQYDGFLAQGPEAVSGPGCSSASPYPASITRLSPASTATRDLPTVTDGPPMPVTDPVQLDGVWLLQGTGLVLAADETVGPAAYLMDRNGTIDTSPQAQGAVTIGTDGQITLHNSGCGDSTLGHAQIRGQAAELTLTATVVTDSCHWYDGHETLVWTRVL